VSVIFTLLLLVYPLVMHSSIHYGHAEIAVYYLAMLLTLPLMFSLLHGRRPSGWMLGTALLALLITVLGVTDAGVMIIIPPAVMFAALFAFFAFSLRAEATPVVTRFAAVIRVEELCPEIRSYTRKATIAWSVFFLAMLMISLLLGLWAPLETWSWFSNFLAYVLIAVMFIAEYLVRRHSLKDHVDYSFLQFLRNLRRVDYRHVFK
jgi:uncharacterized membrane protein